MVHDKRRFCISKVEDAEHLAHQLVGGAWCLCAGWRLGDYLFLNDSYTEDSAQEYAVVKDLGDGTFRQVESITFSWCDKARALELINRVLAGDFDSADHASAVRPRLESPEEHGWCHLCA